MAIRSSQFLLYGSAPPEPDPQCCILSIQVVCCLICCRSNNNLLLLLHHFTLRDAKSYSGAYDRLKPELCLKSNLYGCIDGYFRPSSSPKDCNPFPYFCLTMFFPNGCLVILFCIDPHTVIRFLDWTQNWTQCSIYFSYNIFQVQDVWYRQHLFPTPNCL